MKRFISITLQILFICSFVQLSLADSKESDEPVDPLLELKQSKTKKFENPKYKGYPIEVCLNAGKRQCGQRMGETVANIICRKQGYKKAISWKIKPKRERTFVLGSHIICDHYRCKGFVWVECSR